MRQMDVIYVIERVGGGKRAVAVQHLDDENVLDTNIEGVDFEKDNVLGMYIVQDERVAERAVKAFNENPTQSMTAVIDSVREYQHLEYVKEDPDEENLRLARMGRDTLDMVEKATDELKLRLAWYRSMMKDLLGDGVYTWAVIQLEHHFGQIDHDLFDAFTYEE